MLPTAPSPAAKRRRLLQAASVVPVVLTLPSGAALAAGSLTCDIKSTNLALNLGASLKLIDSLPGDTWMRKRLDKYIVGTSSYIRVNDVWYQVNADGTATPSTPSPEPTTPSGEYYYALVDYAAYDAGAPGGYYYPVVSAPLATPIAGESCWNSLNGTQLGSNILP